MKVGMTHLFAQEALQVDLAAAVHVSLELLAERGHVTHLEPWSVRARVRQATNQGSGEGSVRAGVRLTLRLLEHLRGGGCPRPGLSIAAC